MKYHILILFIFYATLLFGQDQAKVDSLLQLIETDISDQEKVDVNNLLAREYFNSDSSKVAEYTSRAIALAKKVDYQPGIADAYFHLGWAAMKKGNYPRAAEFYHQALAIAQAAAYHEGETSAYNGLGIVCRYQSNYPKALDYYHRSLAIEERLGNKMGMARTYNNIGIVYDEQGNYPKALDYYHRSLKIKEELGHKRGLALSYNNIGVIYHYQDNSAQALDYYLRSLKIYEELDNKSGMADGYNNIGLIYAAQDNYPKALDYYQRSLKIKEELGSKSGTAMSYYNIGEVYLKKKEFPTALQYCNKALALWQQTGAKGYQTYALIGMGNAHYALKDYPKALEYFTEGLRLAQEVGLAERIKEGAKELAKAHQAIGNYKEAYDAYVLFKTMTDSLFNEEQTKKFTSLELNYEFEQEKDSIRIANQNQQALLKKDIENRRITQLATYGGLVLSFALIGVLFFFFKVQKHNNEKLNQANEEIQTINEALNITLNTVEGQRDKIMSSINYAQRIQQAILPSTAMISKLLPSHFILFKPRDTVSGDFYYVQRKHNKTILAAIDCTGHGVPGAFMSMVGNDLLNTIIKDKQITQADKMLTELHQGVRSALQQEETQNQDGMDMALVVIDEENKTLEFAGAKNPLIYIQNSELKVIKGDRVAVGGKQKEAERVFTAHQIDISQPTTFYLFSDGYQDQFGGLEGRKFMIKRFRNLLFEIHEKPMDEQREILDQTIQDWMREGKEEQVDDILVVGGRV